MIYHNNILCVSLNPLIEMGVASKDLWDKWVKSGAKQVQKGGNGRIALLRFDSLPAKYQELIKQKVGTEPEKVAAASPILNKLQPDANAVAFFESYLLANEKPLEERFKKEYIANACVLNAIDKVFTDQSHARKAAGASMKGFWQKASSAVNALQADYKHSLPKSKERLYKVYKEYKATGYESLISKKFGNSNTLKVNSHLERLLLSLYTRPNRPFASSVHTDYLEFLAGKICIIDKATGEEFRPENYLDKKGNPLVICDKTVWNVINAPKNRVIVDSKRSGSFQFNSMHRPHHHRHAPQYSFSKISMDDRDLPRKTFEDIRVKAYYAYDVQSGCVIGRAYSRSKDEALFIDCMLDMFRNIDKLGVGMPLEVEVENHLVSKFFDDLQEMFSFTRFCNPGNSQEKHAEHFNNVKKYTVEKKRHNDIGRWWAKSESKRTDVAKVDDEYVNKKYAYERLVADDLADCLRYNNELHKDQNKYPGMTRWEVLINNVNPNLKPLPRRTICKCIGFKTSTTIRRNQSVTVKHNQYVLSSPSIIERLNPGNYSVDAYYLPNEQGEVTEVYIYQNNKYIDTCAVIERYNTAKGEWSEETRDEQKYLAQNKFVSDFDKGVREGKKEKLVPIAVINNADIADALSIEAKTVTEPLNYALTAADYLRDYDKDEEIKRAEESI